jgi:predicted DNA-binding transcriptional regulator YafY
MRRADRLFDIIQILRSSRKPVTAAMLARELEVAERTVYRDIATLQARRVPIEGAAGIGYVLRRGFDLPPLMFTSEEIDAIAVGARLVRRIRDPKLQAAAGRVLDKIAEMLPEALRAHLADAPFYVSEGSAQPPRAIDPAALRAAIYESRKLRIAYVDEHGNRTERTIWPVAMAYYTDVTLIGAWCELRQDFRNFRVERIAASELLDERFLVDREALAAEWFALPKDRPNSAH